MKGQSVRRWPILYVLFALLQACQSTGPGPVSPTVSTPGAPHAATLLPRPGPTPDASRDTSANNDSENDSHDTDRMTLPPVPTAESALLSSPEERWPGSPSRPVRRALRTGNLPFADLSEVSGLAASGRVANRLWAINDSGNQPMLYAMTREAQAVGIWPVDVRNRDWEALASLRLNGEPYLLIADIGDNLQRHDHYDLHLVREPELDGRTPTTLTPDWTLRFRYEDGPHNAEALSLIDGEILIITKEAVSPTGPVPSGIYTLPLPGIEKLSAVVDNSTSAGTVHVARRAGTMAAGKVSFESRLAASLAGVDLNHVTALDVDKDHNRLWVLTYRHLLRFDRAPEESWAQALARPGKRIHTHSLAQAESLALTDDSLVWLTSEGKGAPLWVLPPD